MTEETRTSTRRVGGTQITAATCSVSPQSSSYKIQSCTIPSRYLSGVGIWQEVRGSNPDRAKIYLSTLTSKTCSGVHPASYSRGFEDSWLGGKGAGA